VEKKLRSSLTSLIENISAGVVVWRLILQNAPWLVGGQIPHPVKIQEPTLEYWNVGRVEYWV
jgi:hypothetical protein